MTSATVPSSERGKSARQRPSRPWTIAIVLIAAFVLIPAAIAYGVRTYVGGAQRAFDAHLVRPDGTPDPVTALAWAPGTQGPLFVGTQSGGFYRIGRDGAFGRGEIGTAATGTQAGAPGTPGAEVLGFAMAISQAQGGGPTRYSYPRLVVRDRRAAQPGGPAPVRLGSIPVDGGLFAATADAGFSLVAGRAAQAEADPKAQQSKAPAPDGVALVRWRLPPSGQASEVGPIADIRDARAVAALPGTSAVVGGDGAGGVFAIDASRPVGGGSGAPLVARSAGHDVAVAALAVAASPDVFASADFATAAADGSLLTWKLLQGSPWTLSRRPVIVPGRTWTRDEPAPASPWARLLAMSDDGSKLVLRNDAGNDILYRLGGAGQPAASIDLTQPSGSGGDTANGNERAAAIRVDALRLLLVAPPRTTGILFSPDWVPREEETLDFGVDLSAPGTGVTIDPTITRAAVWSTRDGLDQLEVFNVASRQRIGRTHVFATPITSAALSPAGTMLAVATSDGALLILDAVTGVPLASVSGVWAQRLVYSPDGLRILVAGTPTRLGDGGFKVLSARSLRTLVDKPPSLPNGFVRFSGDGSRAVRPATGNAFEVLDTGTGRSIATVATGGAAAIAEIAVSGDGSRIALRDADGTLSAWTERADDKAAGLMPALAEDGLRLSADGSTLLLREPSGRLHLSRLSPGDAGQFVLEPFHPEIEATQAELAADGSFVVAAEADGGIRVVPTTETGANYVLPGAGDVIHRMAISPDGGFIAAADSGGRLRVVDLDRAGVVAALPLSSLPIHPRSAVLAVQPLDDAPSAATTGGAVPDGGFAIVLGGSRDLTAARALVDQAGAAGFAAAGLRVYLRQGWYRPVALFATAEQRDQALRPAREISPMTADAYAQSLQGWCPDAVGTTGVWTCPGSWVAAAPTASPAKK